VKILDYALNIQELGNRKTAKYFIDIGGLSVIFGLFMLK
jgi:hypothetical protein